MRLCVCRGRARPLHTALSLHSSIIDTIESLRRVHAAANRHRTTLLPTRVRSSLKRGLRDDVTSGARATSVGTGGRCARESVRECGGPGSPRVRGEEGTKWPGKTRQRNEPNRPDQGGKEAEPTGQTEQGNEWPKKWKNWRRATAASNRGRDASQQQPDKKGPNGMVLKIIGIPAGHRKRDSRG